MPGGGGALKITKVTSIYPNKKPHLWDWGRTVVTATASSRLPKSSVNRPCGWCWRLIPCAPSAHCRVARQAAGFYPQKYSHFAVRNISRTQMGAAPDGKEDQWFETASSLPQNHHCEKSPPPPPPSPPPSAKLLTLPTILTIGRVAAVPLLVCTFYVDTWWGPTATTGIFIAAAITDWLDGYLARKMKLGTPFGAFLDPVADKLMVAATLVLLCTRPLEVGMFGQMSWLLTLPSIAIIGREITMSAVREWAASQGSKLSEAVAVNNLGKWKTATQMTALTILLATRDSSLVGTGTLVASGLVLLYISAWLAVWSLVVYMRKIWRVLLL